MKLTELITNLTLQLRASDARAQGPYPPEVSEGQYLGILTDPDMVKRLIPLLEALDCWADAEMDIESDTPDAVLLRACEIFEEK